MSDSDSNDSEIQRAIELSLRGDKGHEIIDLISEEEDNVGVPTKAAVVCNHTSSSDDENPQNPKDEEPDVVDSIAKTSTLETIKMGPRRITETQKLPGIRNETQKLSPTSTTEKPALPGSAQSSNGGSGLLGLDRKKMEEERISRAWKRKNSTNSPMPSVLPSEKLTMASSAIALDDTHTEKRQKINEQSSFAPSTSLENAATQIQSGSVGKDKSFMVPRWLAESKPLTFADLRVNPYLSREIQTKLPDASAGARAVRPAAVLSHRHQVDLLKPGVHFPNGVVKKTWAYGNPRKDDIKIEEVLQKDDLQLAVLSAYQWDEEWILGKLNMSKTKLICVVQAHAEEQTEMRRNVPKNVRFCFPSMAGQINCMHSKLQLLSHPTHLRIVVPSANLVPYDWGEDGGIMENIVFVIDLPRLPHGQKTKLSKISPFGRELRHFLLAMDMDEAVIDSLLNFDFSSTTHLAFVHSIGGSHSGTDWLRTGYCGLGSAIKELGLDTKEDLEIDVVCASMGKLNIDFVKSIYMAARGDDGTTELDWRSSKPSQRKLNREDDETHVTEWLEHGFRVYFPTRETIAASKGGIKAGGTICFQSKWYDSQTFPRSILRDCRSERPSLLMHSKMLFVRPHKPFRGGGGGRLYVAWAYVGSANLSEAAWGRLIKDRAKKPKLNVRNWECGVVIPVPADKMHGVPEGLENDGTMTKAKLPDPTGAGPANMDVFRKFIPVPMVVPGEEYGKKRPWFYSEN